VSAFVCALDASALLAVLNREPGSDQVVPLLDRAVMSAVNWSETVQKALARNVPADGLRQDVEGLGVTIVPFTVGDAERAAQLWVQTQALGLSLGDRACLALAQREAVPAVTTDRVWAGLSLGVRITVVR
jgi:PIN domain nuclease of toxin-antitoxin system